MHARAENTYYSVSGVNIVVSRSLFNFSLLGTQLQFSSLGAAVAVVAVAAAVAAAVAVVAAAARTRTRTN